MGCVQSYFRKAHNASLSPSSTQASENAGLIADTPTDPKKQLLPADEDVDVITSPPTTLENQSSPLPENGIANGHVTDSNGVSKIGIGLGTGVAALAATTGTVAILGATADTTLDALDDSVQAVEDVKKEVELFVEDVEDVVKNASVSASPITDDKDEEHEDKMSSKPSSPTSVDTKDEADIKDESVTTSPILEDENQPASGKESSQSTRENQETVTTSPEPSKDTTRTESVYEDDVVVKELSRPTSGIGSEISIEKPVEEEDEPFPAPPPPEDEVLDSSLTAENISNIVSESASPTTHVIEETGTQSRNKRSIDELENTEDQSSPSASKSPVAEENDVRPASVVDIESKPQSRAESVVEQEKEVENETELAADEQDDHEPRIVEVHEIVKETSTPPSRQGSATAKEEEDAKVEVEQTPEDDNSTTLRPESSEAVVIEAAVEELTEEVVSTDNEPVEIPVVIVTDEPVVPEEEILETIDQIENNELIPEPEENLEDVETIIPEEVKTPVEDIIANVENAASELAANAATTIQASFRGHQARKNLRKIADAEPVPPTEQQETDVTPSVEEKCSDEEIKGDLDRPSSDDVLIEVTPPQLLDTDNEQLDSLTVNEQSVAPETSDDLTSTEGQDEEQQIINVIINPERQESRTESIEEPDKISEEKSEEQSTVPVESEAETLDAVVNDATRAASIISESIVSAGDSISALRGSERDCESAMSVGEDLVTDVLEAAVEQVANVEKKKETAATTIQASVRGFQARKKLQKIADESQLPLPEPLPDLLPEDPAADGDEDDLPPPPDDCDIEPPPPEDQLENDVDEDIASILTDMLDTPRSPETGEKLIKPDDSEQVIEIPEQSDKQGTEEINDLPPPFDPEQDEAAKLALLQRPQECDELPENRWESEDGNEKEPSLAINTEQILADELAALQKPQECDELPEHRGEHSDVNEASSVEVDDSSQSSAATKIQAGARGFLTRKHMKDTFSTTAPSITDSQQSVGAALTSQEDDDGVQTSGSLETEVQRLSMDESSNIGVTAVIISNIPTTENGLPEAQEVTKGKGLSLDSQLQQGKKTGIMTTGSVQDPITSTEEDQQVWQTLHNELEEAATRIQSNFRGFSTRQRLHRDNAVRMPTISSDGTSEKSDSVSVPVIIRSSGEFHDMMVLPPVAMLDETSVNDDGMAECQQFLISGVGKRLEGHVTCDDVTASSLSRTGGDVVAEMGEATDAVTEQHVAADMKSDSVASAATKIQAGFRGYKVRKQMRQVHADGVKTNGPRRRRSSHNLAAVQSRRLQEQEKGTTLQDRSATKIQAGIRGFLVRKRRREEKDAAVKIQAGFRGYKVRRDKKTRAPVEK